MSDINFCNTKEQLNHLGEVVTGKVDGSPTGADIDTSTLPYTGQVRKTLPALESEYETSIANKEVEADAAIDSYRLLNKGPYASGIALESKFEYITYNGESYFATNPPYTTTSTTPDADANLFLGGYTTFENVANKIGNKNELSNSNFLTPSPDAITHPNATPESYVAGTQIFSGVYAGDSGCTITLIDGRVNCTAGDYQFRLPNSGGLERVTAFTSSVSDYDGIPKTTGISHALVGDEYIVTVTPSAGDVFSVKIEQGSVATRHSVRFFKGSVYYATSLDDAKLNSGQARSIVIESRANAPFKQVDQTTYDSYPDLAKFTDASGRLWGIANANRVEINWFIEDGQTDHRFAWQCAADLKARQIHCEPKAEYTFKSWTLEAFDTAKYILWRAPYTLFGNGATLRNDPFPSGVDLNINLLTSRDGAQEPMTHGEIRDLVVRGAERLSTSNRAVRICFDQFALGRSVVKNCEWHGGDWSALVGVDENGNESSYLTYGNRAYNVLTKANTNSDSSFFFGHCRNGVLKNNQVFQINDTELATFCEVHESNAIVSGNVAIGVRNFCFLDWGGYVIPDPDQETDKSIFTNNIAVCYASFVTPTDANDPFRAGGKVSKINISNNIVDFIPIFAGKPDQVPTGIFGPSDAAGNGVEKVQDVTIDNNIITFKNFVDVTANRRFLSCKAKFVERLRFTNNTVRGINAGEIDNYATIGSTIVDCELSGNKISLEKGNFSATDSVCFVLRSRTVERFVDENNTWEISNPATNMQVFQLKFDSAFSLSFKNPTINNDELNTYFNLELPNDGALLNSGVDFIGIPYRVAGFEFEDTAINEIGKVKVNLFNSPLDINKQVDVTIDDIDSGTFPTSARVLSKFRFGNDGNLLTAPFLAFESAVPTTPMNSMVKLTMKTF